MPNGAGWEQRAKPALRSLQGTRSTPDVLGGSVLCPRSAACTRGARGRGSCPWVPIVGTGSVTAARATPCALGQGPTRPGCARGLKPQPHFSLLAKSSFRVKRGVWFYYYFYYLLFFFPPSPSQLLGTPVPVAPCQAGTPRAGFSPARGGGSAGRSFHFCSWKVPGMPISRNCGPGWSRSRVL